MPNTSSTNRGVINMDIVHDSNLDPATNTFTIRKTRKSRNDKLPVMTNTSTAISSAPVLTCPECKGSVYYLYNGKCWDCYKLTITITSAPVSSGWICPVCGSGLSPYTTKCPCRQDMPSIYHTYPTWPTYPYWHEVWCTKNRGY